MTFKFNNVYIGNTATITGPYESNGPLSKYFDKSYHDFYFGQRTWEQAESHILKECVDILLNKSGKTKYDIDVFLGGDLLNQLISTNYAASSLNIPYLGIYNACATSCEGLIIASMMIDSGKINNAVVGVSSHNNGAEKQFRYPVEYGGPKNKTTTFTTTGAAAILLNSTKSKLRIESGTIGRVVDLGTKDPFNMGAVMTPAAATVLYEHLRDTNREIGYYDLIITGDLGKYGKLMLKDYMVSEYNIKLKNYEDAGCIIYNEEQPVYAGGSGPACLPLVSYSYIFNKMKNGEYKRVLFIATGSLHSGTSVNQKLTIPAIAHAISVEVVE